jgi:hypothetical protein
MSAPAEARIPTEVGWYVYGVVDASAHASFSTPGVGGGDVGALNEGPVTALVSRVPLEEFGEDPVRSRLEDPAWLEEKARAHEAVLAEALSWGPVVPFRFLTMYSDEDELRRFLRARGDDLVAVLERVRGKVELGVKTFVDRGALERSVSRESAAVADLDAEIAAADAGRAYLLKRQRDQIAHDESTQILVALAEDAHARLCAAADHGVANPVQSRELSGRPDEMVLNGAYLVHEDDTRVENEVTALAERYGHLGVTFELTGPWPPYNFVPRDLGDR